MPLIDSSYFVGDINIPDTGNPAVLERLDFFIAKYEAEFLEALLGYTLWQAYVAGIAVTPTPDAKWTDLRDGKEYTVSDIGFKYTGLRNATLKQSPIAQYVYYWWMRNDIKAKPDDAEARREYYEARNRSMVTAWNDMAQWVRSAIHYLDNYADTYTGWQTSRPYPYELWNISRPINSMNL
jgi:hypothetical protein